MYSLLIFWVLPSLITFGLFVWLERYLGASMRRYDRSDWVAMALLCVIYPLGWFILGAVYFKTRSLRNPTRFK